MSNVGQCLSIGIISLAFLAVTIYLMQIVTVEIYNDKKLENKAKDTLIAEVKKKIGTEAKEIIANEAKETTGTKAKDTIANEAKEIIGTKAKTTKGTEVKDTIANEAKQTIGTKAKEITDTEAKGTNYGFNKFIIESRFPASLTRQSEQENNTECYDADGVMGKCINISDYFTKINFTNEEQNIKFVSDSLCLVQNAVQICHSSLPRKPLAKGKCQNIVTAFPPDPRSGCCGREATLRNRISRGEETEVDAYPWMAIIKYKNSNTLCGGFLISNRYVVTAAHCVHQKRHGEPVAVLLGVHDLESDEECDSNECPHSPVTIEIEKVLTHPEYHRYDILVKNDISLIRLREPAPYTDFIRPICLPNSHPLDLQLRPGLKFTVAGWGMVNKTTRSSVKRFTQLHYVDMHECIKSYKEVDHLWSKQICAQGEAESDSCQGDSGGPLMYLNGDHAEAVGVVSSGKGECGRDSYPGVYTTVAAYNTWIRRNILP